MNSILKTFNASTKSQLTTVGLFCILLTACGGEDTTNPRTYDSTPPKITIIEPGDDLEINPATGSHIETTTQHQITTDYVDSGASARDVWDFDNLVDQDPSTDQIVAVKTTGLDSVDVNAKGTYTITYTVEDTSGNVGHAHRKVVVDDYIAPTVTLDGPSVFTVESKAAFSDPGATAFDVIDNATIEVVRTIELCGSYEDNECKDSQVVTAVDTNSSGTYLATYSAADNAGNVGTNTRQIIVLQGFNAEVVVWDGNFGAAWDKGISAFDEALDWGAVNTSGDAPSIDWEIVNDPERGDVIQVAHVDDDKGAGIFIESSTANNLLGAKDGGIVQFDIKIVSGDPNITIKSGCTYPCGGGPRALGPQKVGEWTTVRYPVLNMLPGGDDGSTGLELGRVTTGLEIWATGQRATVFQIDNISWKCVTDCEGVEFVPTFTPWEKTDITDGYDAPNSYDGYTLLWADEFNGTEVDTSKWGFDLGNVSPEGNVGWGNSELQHYRPENATVADGLLTIEAQYHAPLLTEVNGDSVPAGVRYTSSKLLTQGKFSFQYGRVDIRAVVAEGKGLWSAGWMLGDNQSTIGWPRAGEIDIVDTIGGPGQEEMIVNNMYWNPEGPSKPADGKANINEGQSRPGEVLINEVSNDPDETFSNTFHVYSIIWTEDRVDFYVDDVLTTPVTLTGELKETFTQSPFYLILNVAIGGDWPGAPVFEDTDTPTQFPRGMLVDYVRVYQPTTP
jgi:beta-glucanase (GH16 family)